MNREEILARSRNERADEGELHARRRGMAIGIIAMVLVYLLIFILYTAADIPTSGISAILWTYMAANAIPRYRFTKRKLDLVVLICCGLAAVASLINVFRLVMR